MRPGAVAAAIPVPTHGRLVLVSQVMHFVEPSREVLAETLLAAGPDAATLCTGWLTRDLAAHLYLRERKIAVGLGLLIKRLSKASDQATADLVSALTTTENYALTRRFTLPIWASSSVFAQSTSSARQA